MWDKEKPRRLGSGQGTRKRRCESDFELPAGLLGKIPWCTTGLRFAAVEGDACEDLSHAQDQPRTGRPPGRLRMICLRLRRARAPQLPLFARRRGVGKSIRWPGRPSAVRRRTGREAGPMQSRAGCGGSSRWERRLIPWHGIRAGGRRNIRPAEGGNLRWARTCQTCPTFAALVFTVRA